MGTLSILITGILILVFAPLSIIVGAALAVVAHVRGDKRTRNILAVISSVVLLYMGAVTFLGSGGYSPTTGGLETTTYESE
jgi:D-alanyl-lipoteichoic acid acyltransferase DltB (MBOAT superfamily)